MSETEQPTESGAAETPKPRPTPNPASRARRIGGRPTPRPAAAPKPGPADEAHEQPDPVEGTEQPDTGHKVDVATKRPRPATAPKRTATPKAEPKPESKAGPKPKPEREPEAAARSGAPARALPLRWLPAGVLALAAVVLAVFVAIASHGVYWAAPDDSGGAVTTRQEQAVAAAKQCFHDVTSYDYRKLDGLVAKDTACTTGKFRTQLIQSLKTQIIPAAPKAKAVQTAQVNRAGVVSVSADGKQVVVLIYAQLSLTNNTTAKDSRVDVLGAVATMDKVGSDWLISNLDTDVGSASS